MNRRNFNSCSGPSDPDPRGVIRPDELYTLTEVKNRLGIKNAALRATRRSGLRVYYMHKHGYVYGWDWIDYVLTSGGKQDS